MAAFPHTERGWFMTGAGEPCNWCDEQPQEREARKLEGPSAPVGGSAAVRAPGSEVVSVAPEPSSPMSSLVV